MEITHSCETDLPAQICTSLSTKKIFHSNYKGFATCVSSLWTKLFYVVIFSQIFAISINVYDILVAEVFSYVSSAGNTDATDSLE